MVQVNLVSGDPACVDDSRLHRRGVDVLAVPMTPCPDDVNAVHSVSGSVVLFYSISMSRCLATTLHACYDCTQCY